MKVPMPSPNRINAIATVLWIGIALAEAGQAAGGPVVHNNYTVLFDFVIDNPCAAEPVQVSGAVHFVEEVVVDGHAGVHFIAHINNQSLNGVGLVSGNSYQLVGASNSLTNYVGATEYTTSNHFQFIGQGPDNNLLTTFLLHVTTTPDGDITADVFNFRFECR
jgi:hypothetical protein